jgi:dCTP deaminase
MKLSDVDIEKKIAAGEIGISPAIAEGQRGSMSVDLRLGKRFGVFRHIASPYIDLGNDTSAFSMSDSLMDEVELEEGEAFFLNPGELALGITVERITLPADIVGWVDGRSSLARVGLLVHITAHTIDPGWDGRITLEFANIGRYPLALRPGMRICAISFEPLTSPTSRPYVQKKGAKYGLQDGPVPSRIGRDEQS